MGVAAYFLGVAQQRGHMVVGDAYVVVPDCSSLAAGAEDVLVPVHGGNAALVAQHGPHALLLRYVPDLHGGAVCADGKVPLSARM